MLITFFDSQGIIHKELLPEETTMNAASFSLITASSLGTFYQSISIWLMEFGLNLSASVILGMIPSLISACRVIEGTTRSLISDQRIYGQMQKHSIQLRKCLKDNTRTTKLSSINTMQYSLHA
ncbi:hypothetical protein NPIL_596621 [Nephila pilipes]|uniref:Uncharacterized protein n=1 Tax=Nephila pilipes TaxID=299642 RepID=A0A8X6Q7I9_NEPPI|nr:hypothetical protein NPIL_596621 [Nephila pilipes]